MLHVTFCRMALTDATFLLAWLAAMVVGGRFLERPGPGRAVTLGLAVGVAQLIKYNGWLIGAVVAVTALLGPAVSAQDRTRSRLLRIFGWGTVAAADRRGSLNGPWFRFVEAHGGYAALLRHQRGYLDGPSSWPSNWLLQLRQLAALSPEFGTILGPLLALGAVVGLAALARERLSGSLLGVMGLVVAARALYRASTTWWLGAALVVFLLRDESPCVRLVGVWWAVLSILTPMYHPYARLWLPLEASGWLMGGVVVATIFGWCVGGVDVGEWRPDRSRIAAVGIALLAGWAVPGVIPPKPRPLPGGPGEPRDSLRAATLRIVARVPSDVRSVVLLGRPAVLFSMAPALGSRGIASGRMPDSRALLAPGVGGWAVVDGVLLRQEGDSDAVRSRLLRRWEVVAEEPTTLSNATLLDVDPGASTGDLSARSEAALAARGETIPVGSAWRTLRDP